MKSLRAYFLGSSLFGIGLFTFDANAAGFAVLEHGFSGLGNSYAGAAAAAEDSSTVYFNPAGMSLIEKPQLHGGVHFISPRAEFKNLGSTKLGFPTQGSDSETDEEAVVPNLFYVHPLTEDIVWGIGFSVPFGFVTDYEEDWVGRYLARRTELKTTLVNPSLAFRVNKNLSLGVGVGYIMGDAVLSNAIDMGLVFLGGFQAGDIPINEQTAALASDIQANIGGSKYDGGVYLEGDGEGWGYNFGAIYEFSDSWRCGFHFRSGVDLDLIGRADFTVGLLGGFLDAAFQDQGGTVDVRLPQSSAFSLFGKVTERLSVMADVTRTKWSSFHDLTIKFETPSPPDSVYLELWEDVNKYSVGASYDFNPRFKGRIGFAYDESPVPNDELRSPRIPDADRIWLSIGLSIAASNTLDLHLAYVNFVVDDPVVDNSTHGFEERLYGRIDATGSLFSLGLTKRF